MAVALPAGAKLTGLNIAQVAGGSGLDVTAEAADTTAATQVKSTLQTRQQNFCQSRYSRYHLQ